LVKCLQSFDIACFLVDRAVNLLKRYSTAQPSGGNSGAAAQPVANQPQSSYAAPRQTAPIVSHSTPAHSAVKPSNNFNNNNNNNIDIKANQSSTKDSNLDELDALVNQLSIGPKSTTSATAAPRSAVSRQVDDDLNYLLGSTIRIVLNFEFAIFNDVLM
jgi:hypothetical protein